MPDITVRSLSGEQLDTITLSDLVFGAPLNGPLIHQAATRLLAARRLGTQKAKTRGEVHGTTAKPYRQKGTGRARQGSRKSPLAKGGGVVFAPSPRSYATRMPKKMRRQATRSALSSRITDNGIVVVSSLQPEQPRTKSMIAALGNISVAGKVLLIDEHLQEDTTRSARNIPGVTFKPASVINIVDVLDNDVLLFSIDGIRQLERILTDGDV